MRERFSCLVGRKIKADDVIGELFNLFVLRSIPEHIR
jgi:putative transposase